MKSPFFQVVFKLRKDVFAEAVYGDIILRTQLQAKIPDIKVGRLFTSLSFDQMQGLVERGKSLDKEYQPPDFLAYHFIGCSTEADAKVILESLLIHKNVERAYIINDSAPPDTSTDSYDVAGLAQGYLRSAPGGVDADYAWESKGGNGEGSVKFIDIEQGWILNHESISVNTLPCTGFNHAFHDHGAAVLGIIMMHGTNRPERGISPKVLGYVVSQWRPDGFLNNADAIMASLPHLQFGDVLLLQAQVRDLTAGKKLWPLEIHTASFDVIRLATALGIIVIEPAANGSVYFNLSSDLDYFIQGGKKIFNRMGPDFRDSGAIMVAGATASVPHTRIYNSNYGSRIDCYAWGENVFTAGNFPNSSEGALDKYTEKFSGTSSAAAIVAGVAISLQGMMEANLNFRIGPAEMRRILSSEFYGTPSANGISVDKIGVMPDLKKIVDNFLFERAVKG